MVVIAAAEEKTPPPNDAKIVSPLRQNFKPSTQAAYYCGACGAQQDFDRVAGSIRCNQCGYRILYKTRERRVIRFQAR
ncbi:hypothetical protein AAMO2058_001728100 [Amorphochlora amoebiformis]